MEDIHALHRQLCPKKFLGNFWKSKDYKAVEAIIGPEAATQITRGHRGQPAQTLVPKIVALAFLHWADPVLFYRQLHKKRST